MISTAATSAPARPAATAPREWAGKPLFQVDSTTDREYSGFLGRTKHDVSQSVVTGSARTFTAAGTSLVDAIKGARELVAATYEATRFLNTAVVLQDPVSKHYFVADAGHSPVVDPDTDGHVEVPGAFSVSPSRTRSITTSVTVTPMEPAVKAVVGRDTLYDFTTSSTPQTQTSSTVY